MPSSQSSQPAPIARTFQALLNAAASCTLDANGNGVALCGPTGLGNSWTVFQVAVQTSTNLKTPIANLFLGPLLPTVAAENLLNTAQVTQIAGSSTGNNDSIGLLGITLQPYQALLVQWEGGDSGAQATMTVTGSQIATYWQ